MTTCDILKKISLLIKHDQILAVSSRNAAVGMTLEAYLGIAPNNIQGSDIGGIEIKSGIKGKSKFFKNPITAFTKSPTWRNDKYDNPYLLKRFGTKGKYGLNLFCNVNNQYNSKSLKVHYDESTNYLIEIHSGSCEEEVAYWDVNTLKNIFINKFEKLIAVNAERIKIEDTEYYSYKRAYFFSSPKVEAFNDAIKRGNFTLCHMLMTEIDGTIKDRGYAFRINFDIFENFFETKKAIE